MKREWFPPAVSAMASRLSWLWVFYMFNTAYIDINTLYYSVFINHHSKVHYTQTFLLGAAVLVEIPTAMVILSRMLGYRWNRLTNVMVLPVAPLTIVSHPVRWHTDSGVRVHLCHIDRHVRRDCVVRLELVRTGSPAARVNIDPLDFRPRVHVPERCR